MIPRRSLAVALAIGLLPGCGMAVRKLDEETLAAATTSHRSYPDSPHRVALATFEVMRAELTSAEFDAASEFAPSRPPLKPDGSRFREGELPPGFPAFWLEWKNDGRTVRSLVSLKAAHFAGKASDGRPVEVNVVAQSGESLVTVRFAKLGDRMFSIWLLDRVANRLAHPVDPVGSPEEAASFQAFFGGVESREALLKLRKPADAPASPSR